MTVQVAPRIGLAVALVAAALCFVGRVHAQAVVETAGAIDPVYVPAGPTRLVMTPAGSLGPAGHFHGSAFVTFATDLLSEPAMAAEVRSRLSSDISLSVAPLDGLRVRMTQPLVLAQWGLAPGSTRRIPRDAVQPLGRGDLRLGVDWRVIDPRARGTGLTASLTLVAPTSDESVAFAGEAEWVVAPGVFVDEAGDGWIAAAGGELRVRSGEQTVGPWRLGDAIVLRAGAGLGLTGSLTGTLEGVTTLQLASQLNAPSPHAFEVGPGVRWAPRGLGFVVRTWLAAGVGGLGAAGVRVVVGVENAPRRTLEQAREVGDARPLGRAPAPAEGGAGLSAPAPRPR